MKSYAISQASAQSVIPNTTQSFGQVPQQMVFQAPFQIAQIPPMSQVTNLQPFQSNQQMNQQLLLQNIQSPKGQIQTSQTRGGVQIHSSLPPQNQTVIHSHSNLPNQFATMNNNKLISNYIDQSNANKFHSNQQELVISPERRLPSQNFPNQQITVINGQNIQRASDQTMRTSNLPDVSFIQQHQQSQKIQYKQHKFEQTLQVVDLKQYQDKWQKRINELEDQIRVGGGAVQQYVEPQETVYFEDDTKLRSYLEQLKQMGVDKANIHSNLEQHRNESSQKERDLQEKITQQLKEINDLKAQRKELENQLEQNNDELDKLDALILQKENECESKDKIIQELMDKNKSLSNQFQELQKDLDSLQEEYNQIKAQQRLTQKELQEKIEDIEDLQNQLEDLNNQLSQKNREIRNLNNDNDNLQGDLKQMKKDAESKQGQVKELQDKNKASQNQIKDLENDIKNLKKKLDEKNTQNEQLQRNYDDLHAEFEDLNGKQQEEAEKIVYLVSEMGTWKKKFVDLNRTHHEVLEDLTMVKAELDHMKQDKKTEPTTMAASRSSVRGNTMKQQPRDNIRESNANYETPSNNLSNALTGNVRESTAGRNSQYKPRNSPQQSEYNNIKDT